MGIIEGSKTRNEVNGAAFTIGAEAADVINVAVQLQTESEDIAERASVLAYLSGDAEGDGVAGAAPSGGVAAGTNGEIIAEITADLVFLLKTDATGSVDVDITDVGTPTFHLVVCLPDGTVTASDAITFA